MKFATATTFLASLGLASAYIQGFDVSDYQPNVDWSAAYNSGARFVFIKATEGTYYTSPSFSNQYIGATNAGFIRNGYHFARPDTTTGATQADYFLSHGGGWSGDGITLPGMLDIEYNPYGAECYGLSHSAMVSWVSDFVNTYHSKTSRYPMIYTTADWWSTCTGNSNAFSSTCPLVLADYNSSPGTIPGGWPYESFWQNNDAYTYGGDSDLWNGDMAGLQRMATG